MTSPQGRTLLCPARPGQRGALSRVPAEPRLRSPDRVAGSRRGSLGGVVRWTLNKEASPWRPASADRLSNGEDLENSPTARLHFSQPREMENHPRRKRRNRWKGAYTPRNFRSSRHGDGRKGEYDRDNLRQYLQRKETRQLRLDHFFDQEEECWRLLLEGVEPVLNDVVIDRQGQYLSVDAREALMQERKEDRCWFRRRDGKPQRLRSQPYARDPLTGEVLEDANGKKIRRELPAADVPVIYHEAIMLDPRLSLMVVLATRAGLGEQAKSYLFAGAKDVVELWENITGLEIVDVPYHAKVLGGHYQPEFVLVDAAHRKLGSADALVHLGRPMLGVLRWRSMGVSGKDLDRLTGVPDSDAGLDDALADRGARATDKKVMEELDQRMWARLREEESFRDLLPFLAEAEQQYADYRQRKADAISRPDEEAQRKIEQLGEAGAQQAAMIASQAEALELAKSQEGKATKDHAKALAEKERLTSEMESVRLASQTAQLQADSAEKDLDAFFLQTAADFEPDFQAALEGLYAVLAERSVPPETQTYLTKDPEARQGHLALAPRWQARADRFQGAPPSPSATLLVELAELTYMSWDRFREQWPQIGKKVSDHLFSIAEAKKQTPADKAPMLKSSVGQ